MDNVFVYCEIEGTVVAEVSQELLTKGRKLADGLGVELHAVVAGTGIKGAVESQILPYGVDKLFVFDGKDLFPYTSAPHTDILVNLFKEEKPQICLMGATVIGRDLGPRVSSSLTSGLTADCTQLEIGDFDDVKTGKSYKNLLYQIRPAFGGNIVAGPPPADGDRAFRRHAEGPVRGEGPRGSGLSRRGPLREPGGLCREGPGPSRGGRQT